MKVDDVHLIERLPTVEEYQCLREAFGWPRREYRVTETAIAHSLFATCVLYEETLVGCGRLIGDAGLYFYIQDVMISPAFQRKGLGTRIMESILSYLSTQAQPGAFVGLMAAKGAEQFYLKLGFSPRPSALYGPGMFRIWGER